MAKKSVSPIMTWIFWSIVVLGVFLAVTWEYFVAGFTADTSNITWIILGFFVLGLFFSLRAAFYLESEFKSLRAMSEDERIGDPNSSDLASLFDSAAARIQRGERIQVRNLISAYGGSIKSKVDNIGVVAGMLITIGLLGTVVGLIITVTGLGNVLKAGSADYAAMKAGLNQTVSGMGTAFYTTFFGALLGGVVLKVLGAEMKRSGTQLVADALRFSELYVAPQFQKQAEESLDALEGRIVHLDGQLEQLGESFGAAINTLDSKQSAMAASLHGLLESIEQTNQAASDRVNALSSTVESTIEETNRLADERLRNLAGTIEQTNTQANERTSALVSSIESTNQSAAEQLNELVKAVQEGVANSNRQMAEQLAALVETSRSTVEETNRLADERLAALVDRVGLVMDQTHSKADERLDTLASAISRTTEETHRLADERLQTLAKAVETATQSTHQKADARLAVFVDSVEQSIEQSRKDAEKRLHAKASDLAGKLNEAATMLSALVSPQPVVEDELVSDEE